jgi:hypothetical protein
MMKFVRKLFAIALILGIFSCVDEINLSLEESNQAIVIEAWLGNTPGDTFVKVYRTSPYVSGVLSPNYIPVPVKSVVIEQSSGGDILFSQVEGNLFRQSNSFDPVPGRNYRMVLETKAGEVYESDWETMPPLVKIEDINAQAFQKQVMTTVGQTQFFQFKTFADVQAQISDPGLGELGYLIESSGITELYTSASVDNCACTCYERVPNIFAGMNLKSNQPFQGRSFGLSLGEIPLSSLGRFFVSTKVKTVNKSSYDYLRQVDQQQRNSGSIFDPAPFRIKGNIKKRGAENQRVLGGFFLYQESSFEKLLYRIQIRNESLSLNHSIDALPFVNGSCTEFYINASPIVPPAFRP